MLAQTIESFSNDSVSGNILTYVVLFFYYLVQYMVIIFANTALVGAAMIRLKGGDPTVNDGVRIATQRMGPILGYAAIAATVGVLLSFLRDQQNNLLGRLVVGLIGGAWNIVTFLVVPVLAAENVGPIDAIKRSASLLKQTWGEQIVGNFAVGTIFFLLMLGCLIIFGPFIFMAFTAEQFALAAGLVVTLVILWSILGIISSALTGIYKAALYQYALSGDTGQFFRADMVQHAFRAR
jgi:hypothetical protein